MFTGIVEEIGIVRAIRTETGNLRLNIEGPKVAESLAIGDSIAHNGVCLTVEAVHHRGWEVVAVRQTLASTRLGRLGPGDRVNLERACTLSTRLGGHIVQGHIDGLAVLESRRCHEGSTAWTLRLPDGLERYCVPKGSIALDGMSLTLAEVRGPLVVVHIVPHTARVTTAGYWTVGDRLHLEVDVLARHVEKLLGARLCTP